MAANEARRDLHEKLRLENRLAGELIGFNRKLVRATISEFAESGRTFRADGLEPELAEILAAHYDEVAVPFSSQLTDDLPDDIAATDTERAAIAAALASFFAFRAPTQAGLITGTNQQNIDDAVIRAAELTQAEVVATGAPLSRREQATLVGADLRRKLTGRVTGIATTETQTPAEASKLTEADILTGQSPSVSAGSSGQVSNVTKEWVTVGDEKVRTDHIIADSQTRDLNAPFEVGGEALQYPGDMSQGATIGNVANCRCSSVVSRSDVLAVRRERGEEPRIDLTASDQLLISLGE